ncbi:hypothetical protein BJ166DRAFT_61694 [Pestalotiopsis sp. NC0098]|nr:hypothetical protein BJ166DRAFT_61694 [Pestalotiopsis sp. NC0098]
MNRDSHVVHLGDPYRGVMPPSRTRGTLQERYFEINTYHSFHLAQRERVLVSVAYQQIARSGCQERNITFLQPLPQFTPVSMQCICSLIVTAGTFPFFTECNTDTRWIVAASTRFLRNPSHPGILQPRTVTIYSCRAYYHAIIHPSMCNGVPFGKVKGYRFAENTVVRRMRVCCDLDLSSNFRRHYDSSLRNPMESSMMI